MFFPLKMRLPTDQEQLMNRLAFALGVFVLWMPSSVGRAAEALVLRSGDRVVLLGNTLIEREQRYGYWETALTRAYPGKNILFRNLGWSGDTVFGHARAGFGSVQDGFKHLREHVLALKPTVIILGYGANESFDGPSGLPRFLDGCKTLLAALAPSQARIVWLAPLRQEKLSPPLPDPAQQNEKLKLYSTALAELAAKNNQTFVDLSTLVAEASDRTGHLTDNGIHLTAQGYWRAALSLDEGLGHCEPTWKVQFIKGKVAKSKGTDIRMLTGPTLRWESKDALLPFPPAPDKNAKADLHADPVRSLQVEGLTPGKYALKIDGRAILTANAETWGRGVSLARGPEFDQVEQLRAAILAKNQLYFHRWRPQNETYLFGFRKQEQGQNAREIPQFDPLVAGKEEEILKLSSPRTHIYEITPGASR
jgi:lysophospholipase L1-like esterase